MSVKNFRHWLGTKCRSFVRSREGMLPVIFAVAIVPALGLVGLSIDYAGTHRAKASLQSAMDAAVLEAVTLAERLDTANGVSKDFKKTEPGYEPIGRATTLFNTLVSEVASIKNVDVDFEVSREGNVYRAKGKYTASYKSRMPTPTTSDGFELTGFAQSTTSVSGSGFMDIYTLLDTSGSMGIGATKADIDRLKAEYNCAFSCHGEKPSGVQLRIDVMRTAVYDMITQAEAQWSKDQAEAKGKSAKGKLKPRIKIALNKFDHEVTELEGLTDDYKRLREDVAAIKLDGWRGTNAKRALDHLTPIVPKSGTGLAADSPRRFVFMVTDGLQDRASWYPQNFPGPTGADSRTGPIDPAACDGLKAKGVTVAILYTTQVGIPGYEWYWQKPQPSIRPNLEACASQNFFFEAKDGAALSTEFQKMFKKAVEAAMARIEK
jgi:Flp pilus assembly protein TadG